jgi:hypothetical protein
MTPAAKATCPAGPVGVERDSPSAPFDEELRCPEPGYQSRFMITWRVDVRAAESCRVMDGCPREMLPLSLS